MSGRAKVVIFFNDWKVFPDGVNSGGGESATLALARRIAALGYPVIACANLPNGECSRDGIEFWDFGANYSLHTIERRLRDIGPYHCLCATLVHPFLMLRDHGNCLSRILVNHSPSPHASGLEPVTVLSVLDYMACVSSWQRGIIEACGVESEKLVVVKNGFDPELFPYAGPEGRDWNQLVFVGRVEPAKGIHVLVHAFGELKGYFPDLKLSVYGDDQRWADFAAKKDEYAATFPGLVFHGKVPQAELSRALRRAGLLVFPSLSFESAGLAVVEAQASGCPVVAFDAGGTADYLDKRLGLLLQEKSMESLRNAIATLLRDRAQLAEMSRLSERFGRERTWDSAARDIMALAERAVERGRQGEPTLPEPLRRVGNAAEVSIETLLRDHERICQPDFISETELNSMIAEQPTAAWPHFVRGLRLESAGNTNAALAAYTDAMARASADDWQPHFRLALLHVDRRQLSAASTCAQAVLARVPSFPLKTQLEKIIAFAKLPAEQFG